MAIEVSSANDHSKQLTMEISRMTEDQRKEQEKYSLLEKQRIALEVQVKDLNLRLEETETAAVKNNKKATQRLDQRISELEVELDSEQRRYEESQKNVRKLDRRVKELLTQLEEELKTKATNLENYDKLEQKVKVFKRQVEEAVSYWISFF